MREDGRAGGTHEGKTAGEGGRAGRGAGEGPGRRCEISLREALPLWVKVAAYSFGGPAGQIAVMQRLLVDEARWMSQSRFLHALNYCMFLPGPEAQQLATYGGWLLHGWRGGLVAGGLFVLPGFLSILLLSVLYAGFRDLPFVDGLFYGLKPAVLAIVVQAVVRIGARALRGPTMVTIAAAAFVAIFVFDVPFPAIIAAAALLGYLSARTGGRRPRTLPGEVAPEEGSPEEIPPGRPPSPGPDGPLAEDASLLGDAGEATRPSWRRTWRTAALWLLLWWAPVGLLALLLGAGHVFVTEGVFFSKMAVVTFGGAYAALAYVAQRAVETYGWLQPGEMLDGLGMAETTPGPLIQVVQFVGFMGAYRNPGILDPLLAGLLGSLVTTWVTFAPCFLWIFVGAPYIEYLRGRRSLTAALSGITAAVVGVILNLAVWFGIHTSFAETRTLRGFGMELLLPVWSAVDPAAVALAGFAFLALLRLRWGILKTLGATAAAGLAYRLLLPALTAG